MPIKNPQPPVIVIGMHRSGTSMVCRLLDRLGLFLGRFKNRTNHEAYFFYLLNEWLLRQCGAAWDHPEPARLLSENEAFYSLAIERLRFVLRTPLAATYLGPAGWLRYGGPANLCSPWGWKDPRNTLTLPLWLGLFPEAKVIHVYRHGVDVAASLKRRHEMELATARNSASSRGAWRQVFPLATRRITHTLRCARLEEGLNLWEEYLVTANEHVSVLGEQAIAVCFEELLAQPHEHLRRLAQFVHLERVTEDQIAQAAETIRADRAYAYRQDAALADFAQTHRNRLGVFGY